MVNFKTFVAETFENKLEQDGFNFVCGDCHSMYKK